MTESFDVSIVVCTWNRPADLLLRSVHTLSNQTVQPREIIVVDSNTRAANTEHNRVAVAPYPLVKFYHAPRDPFNVARAMNYGIKRAEGKWLAATCMEELFSVGTVAAFARAVETGQFIEGYCGTLRENANIGNIESVHARWDTLLVMVEPGSNGMISTGAWIGAATEWWHQVRGYDEVHYPYENPDADLARQAGLAGLKQVNMAWGDCQILHQRHPVLKPEQYESSTEWYYDMTDDMVRGRARNPEGWGEG